MIRRPPSFIAPKPDAGRCNGPMRLSAKGRYTVTCLLDLALHARSGRVTLADIAERQGLSLSYVEQLFARLRQADLVHGVRGPGGGYRLAHPAHQISVAQVLVAVEEQVDATACQGEQDCDRGEQCLTHELWSDLSGQIQEFLGGITLQMLMDSEGVASLEGQPAQA